MGTPVTFTEHSTLPTPAPKIRGGRFMDAIRHLIQNPDKAISFPHSGTHKSKASLRVGLGNAGRALGVEVETKTTPDNIFAILKGRGPTSVGKRVLQREAKTKKSSKPRTRA